MTHLKIKILNSLKNLFIHSHSTKIYSLVLGLIFFFLMACLNNSKPVNKAETYFNLKEYFEDRQTQYTKNHYHLYKTVWYKDKKSSLETKAPDWSRELFFFREADLNKPSWAGLYSVVRENGNLIYQALDTLRLNIREVRFYHFNQNSKGNLSFDSIRITKKQNDFLSKIYSVLVFKPDSFYSIQYNQDIRFYKKNNYKINVSIRPK